MSLARTPDGGEYTAPGFNHGQHDRWVAAGHCPVVSVTKAWCSKRDGHPGEKHSSPRYPLAGVGPSVTIEWEA